MNYYKPFFIISFISLILCQSSAFSQKLVTVVTEKYQNGNKKEEVIRSIIDDYNQPIVKKITYCEDGSVLTSSEVSDGLLHGEYLKYSYCGYGERILEESIIYKNGKKHGLEEKFYANGKKEYEVVYFEDLKNSIEKKYNRDGILISKIPYEKGKIIGETYNLSSKTVYEGLESKNITQKLYKTYDNGLWDCSMRVEVLSKGFESGRECYSMIFPVKYTMPDKSIMTIEQKNQLEKLDEWYWDNRLEVFDLFVYPVSFKMPDRSEIIIDAKDNLKKIENWYKNNRSYRQDPRFVFPLNLIMPDKSKKTVNNKDELNEVEDLVDDFYKEIGHKINYPIIILYETDIKDVLKSINSDDELKEELKKCESYNNTEDYPRQLLERYSGYYRTKSEKQMKNEKDYPSDYQIYNEKEYFSSPDYHCDSREYKRYGSKSGGDFIKDGLYESWFENGEKYHARYIQSDKQKEKIEYVDGKINGHFQKWYDNGNSELKVEYSDDKKNGSFQSWFYNGQRKVESNFIMDVQNGDYEEWHENGTQMRKMKYNIGLIDSIDKKWDSANNIVWEKNYKEGQLIEYKLFSSKGTILIEKSVKEIRND